MDLHAWVAVGTLLVAVALFISKWIPLAATALSIPVVLAATGTLDPEECLSGFGNQAVIALAGIFILGAGLQESGVATLIARGLEHVGGKSPTRTIVVIMVAVAWMSAFMSNTATVAVLLPAVALLSRRTGIPASSLMMPLAFAAILGGMLTLIGTTPNLILGDLLRERTGKGLGMFDFTAVGAPVVGIGIAFMAFFGWRMLPKRDPKDRLGKVPMPEDLAKSYGFAQSLYRMKVVRGSSLAGQTIAEARVGADYGLDVVLLMRSAAVGQRSVLPGPDLAIEVGDELYLEGEVEDAERMAKEKGLRLSVAAAAELDRILSRGVTLAEVTLSPRCGVLGQTFKDLEFRKKWHLNVLSVWRRDEAMTGVADLPLQLGDAFLVSGSPARIQELAKDPDFVVLGDGSVQGEDVSRAPLAIGLLVLAILPPLFDLMPLAMSAMAAALLMVFTRCVTIENARRSVDFTILFLIIGTIPLGNALEQSGVAAKMAGSLLELQDYGGAPALLAGLFLLSAVLSTTSNNGAAAVILAPVAYSVAQGSNMEPAQTFLAVAYGTSCAFVLPFAHQCNLLVMGPAGYSTRDFMRVGALMSLIIAIATVALLSIY